MSRWLVAFALLAGCSKRDEGSAPPPAAVNPGPSIPAPEIKRGQDACQAYLDQVCACAKTVPAAAGACQLARPLVDAEGIALGLAADPAAEHLNVLHAEDSFRKTVAECIEQTANLPALGCPVRLRP